MYNNDYGIELIGVSSSQMEMIHSLERKMSELKIKHKKTKTHYQQPPATLNDTQIPIYYGYVGTSILVSTLK